uniref:Uncharacterized protein n=1 Tax=Wuchereria bancrofti TaxID=6293 RepID=A0A1I8EIN9_WUCBA
MIVVAEKKRGRERQYLQIAIANAMLPEQELRLLYLYDDEIMKRIALHHVEAVKFALLLRPNEYETLTEQYNFNWNVFSVKLWERLWEAPTRALLFETVLSFLLSCKRSEASQAVVMHQFYKQFTRPNRSSKKFR